MNQLRSHNPSPRSEAKSGDTISWRDKAGHIITGIALHYRKDHMIAGTQNQETPFVWVTDNGPRAMGGEKRKVANNILWVVPYTYVMAAPEPA